MMKTVFAFLVSTTLCAASVWASQPPTSQSEWVAVKELPAADQLPAAPLLIAAYAVVWVVLMAYLWSIRRRLGQVERELAALQRRAPETGTGR